MKIWMKGERGAKMMRDRKEESEDFCPTSVPALPLIPVLICGDSQLSYGCSSAWGDWYLLSVVMLGVKEGPSPFIDTLLHHQSANSCVQLWKSFCPKRGSQLNPHPLP